MPWSFSQLHRPGNAPLLGRRRARAASFFPRHSRRKGHLAADRLRQAGVRLDRNDQHRASLGRRGPSSPSRRGRCACPASARCAAGGGCRCTAARGCRRTALPADRGACGRAPLARGRRKHRRAASGTPLQRSSRPTSASPRWPTARSRPTAAPRHCSSPGDARLPTGSARRLPRWTTSASDGHGPQRAPLRASSAQWARRCAWRPSPATVTSKSQEPTCCTPFAEKGANSAISVCAPGDSGSVGSVTGAAARATRSLSDRGAPDRRQLHFARLVFARLLRRRRLRLRDGRLRRTS